jgi:hypothetical protein
MFDENWEFKTVSSNIAKPVFIKPVGNELFIAAENGVYKTDKDVNILASYTSSGAGYRGIFFLQATGHVVVANYLRNTIEIFYRNLTYITNIPIPTMPYSFGEYEGNMFVGTKTGQIIVINNYQITKTYITGCTSYLTSFIIDPEGYLLYFCYDNYGVYLYHTNGTDIGKSIKTPTTSENIRIDSKGRLIVSSYDGINIYY